MAASLLHLRLRALTYLPVCHCPFLFLLFFYRKLIAGLQVIGISCLYNRTLEILVMSRIRKVMRFKAGSASYTVFSAVLSSLFFQEIGGVELHARRVGAYLHADAALL